MTDSTDYWFTPYQPPTRCSWCSNVVKPGVVACRECRHIETNLSAEWTDADALTGGAWVNDRGVMRWEPGHVA